VDDRGQQRYTTREMLSVERGLLQEAELLAARAGHGIDAGRAEAVLSQHLLSAEQREAFDHVTGAGDLKVLVGVAGSGKSTTLSAMREAWEAEGLAVKGAALSGIAAQNLQVAAGIASRTLASYELAWQGGRDALSARDVLVIDEAGMLGTRQLARVLEAAQKAQAKVVLVGDPEQLQAIEAGAPFRGIAAQHGVAGLSEVRRQHHDWQRTATAALSSGKTAQGLAAYEQQGGIVAVQGREQARAALLARWARDAKLTPADSQLVLAYTRADVQALNASIRALRQQTGQLEPGQVISTTQGKKEFSVHDRVRFLRNERALGVRNGSLGTVERIEHGVLQVRLDGAEKTLAVDTKFYAHLDHGYAATVHKAQGSTVDRSYVLATPHFDRHTAYVALSRHREAVTVFYAQDDFGGRGGRAEASAVQARFVERLSRSGAKDLAHDYLVRDEGLRQEASAAPEVPAPALTAAQRLRQRSEQVAQRLAVEREHDRPAREALEREHELERRRQLELEQQRQLAREKDHGLEL
jgi:Ti-type conjugative transfer relaxase TraA